MITSRICSDLRTVNKQNITRNQLQLDTYPGTVTQNLLQGFFVPTPEFRYGLMIGLQPSHEPDKGYVVVTLPLKLTGTLHTIGITIDEQLEH